MKTSIEEFRRKGKRENLGHYYLPQSFYVDDKKYLELVRVAAPSCECS